jgi:C-terminal processing protease CtpA/Prc
MKQARFPIARWVTAALFLCLSANFAGAQDISASRIRLNRDRGLQILSTIKDIMKNEYYDPKFHGLNLDQHFKATKARIQELDTAPQIFTAIAQFLLDFNDSHTRYLPPDRINEVEYGFSMQMIGDACRVVEVKHGGNAEMQGLKVGDDLSDISGYSPRRNSLWALTYLLYSLDPRPELTLTVIGIDGHTRQMLIPARLVTPDDRKRESNRRKEMEKQRPELKTKPYKCQEVNSGLIACKLYTFLVETSVIDKMMKEVGEHEQMILDLRGNEGGHVQTETYLAGYFFDHDVKIGSEIRREKTIERIAKSRKAKTFNGKLVVLVDSRSASAAEVVARVMQIAKRAPVVGDTSAGAVMTSVSYPLDLNVMLGARESVYGWMSITIGDLVMSDGQRLEGAGVVPDFINVPSGRNLAERSDPTLAFAASLCGAHLSEAEAGKFYFIARVPEEGDEDEKDDN